MCAVLEFDPEVVFSRLEAALTQLVHHDNLLLEVDVSERCLMHALAFHLKAEFSDWDVDCEYNREGHEAHHYKQVHLPSRSNNPETEFRIFPDIVIHRRTKPMNLLVVEIKKSSNHDPGAEAYDHEKLTSAVRGRLGYSCGSFVRLRTDGTMTNPYDFTRLINAP